MMTPADSRPGAAPSAVDRYLEPTQQAGRAFAMRQAPGTVIMLNLMRFRTVADYSAFPELAPLAPISGAAAFQRYIDRTLPFLRESGGDLVFLGTGEAFLIGPADERWDAVMLVRQRSAESFLAFASHRLTSPASVTAPRRWRTRACCR